MVDEKDIQKILDATEDELAVIAASLGFMQALVNAQRKRKAVGSLMDASPKKEPKTRMGKAQREAARKQAVGMIHRGIGTAEIAEATGYSVHSIYRMRRQLKHDVGKEGS